MSALTLYSITDILPALLDSYDMTAPGSPERAEIDAEIGFYVGALPAKVDGVARMLTHFESQVELADAEIERLEERKRRIKKALERLEVYVVRILEGLPEPSRGPRKLEGSTSTLALRKCPPSVSVDDDSKLPGTYLVTTQSQSIDKQAIRRDLLAGMDVPGARLVTDKYKLKVL